MNHYSLEFPYIFLLLPIIWFCQKKCPAKGEAIYFPHIQLFFAKKAIKSRLLEIFKWMAIILTLIALASPVKITQFEAKQNARDIMLILDSSESMLEKGFDDKEILKSKFKAVTDVIEDFVKTRKGDRIGLITFASSAFIASPLTFDKEYLEDIVAKQKVGLVGKKTAIYDSLLRAIYLLQNDNAKSKIAILLTDGKDNMSVTKFEDLLKFVKKTKTKLYIIGVGSKKDLDIVKLKQLAQAGDGKFYIATDKKSLKSIYNDIDKIETGKIEAKIHRIYTYYFYFPLVFALIFLMLFIYYKSVKGVAK